MASVAPRRGKVLVVRIFLVLVFLLLAAGLSTLKFYIPPTSDLGGPAEFTTYSQGRPDDGKLLLDEDSRYCRLIENWLSRNRFWTPSTETYAPGDLIASDSVEINVQGNRVILNVHRRSNWAWSQYSTPSDEEIKRLVKELREQLAEQDDSSQSP